MTDRSRLTMLLFIVSEGVFFLMLVLGYVFFHHATHVEAARVLDPVRTGAFSLLLFGSSVTLHRAGQNAQANRRRALGFRLGVTLLLGAGFLAGQGIEYADLLGRGVTVAGGLFGTTFFTLTGFHALHVFLGLCALGTLLGLDMAGRLGKKHAGVVEAISMYWHFVDGVWVVIFSVVYLWGVR